MCKLFSIVEIENQKNAEVFAKKAIPLITKTDNHGLGIMRLGERGVHIQRWLNPPKVVRKKKSLPMQKYALALSHQENEAGTVSRDLQAIAIHGRFATCAKTLENVHPFYKDGSALIHNGVISNSEKFEKTVSSCDSEALLSQYLTHDVRANASQLTTALDGVGGYYAAMVFNDNGTIDIWRDNTATLFLAHVREVGIVIATTEEIIIGTARKCRARLTGIDEILPFTHLRWDRGQNPEIRSFTANKPITTYAMGDTFEGWQEKKKEDYWFKHDDWRVREEERVAKWKAQEEAEERELEKLYDEKLKETGWGE